MSWTDKLRAVGVTKTRRKIESDRRKIVYARDGKRCRYCNTKVEYHEFHVDHILPVYHYGNDYVFNLCVACPTCNMKKGANKNIVPPELSIFRKLYGLILILKYRDWPTFEDFT